LRVKLDRSMMSEACPMLRDADRRLAVITAKGDPLEMIARVVPFEGFRAEIEAAVLTPVNEKKSSAGRKPIDVMVMFRMLVLQSLYNLSDEQVEYRPAVDHAVSGAWH
jgi:transposase, IS5 family